MVGIVGPMTFPDRHHAQVVVTGHPLISSLVIEPSFPGHVVWLHATSKETRPEVERRLTAAGVIFEPCIRETALELQTPNQIIEALIAVDIDRVEAHHAQRTFIETIETLSNPHKSQIR